MLDQKIMDAIKKASPNSSFPKLDDLAIPRFGKLLKALRPEEVPRLYFNLAKNRPDPLFNIQSIQSLSPYTDYASCLFMGKAIHDKNPEETLAAYHKSPLHGTKPRKEFYMEPPKPMTKEEMEKHMMDSLSLGIRHLRSIIEMSEIDDSGKVNASILGAKIRAVQALDKMIREGSPMASTQSESSLDIDEELKALEGKAGISPPRS